MNRRAFLQTVAAAPLVAAGEAPPNVVLIYADDLGFGDLHVYGSSLSTPNIDKLAAEGVRFTNWTSANPVCSPSRASLLTGRYPTRVGVPKVLFPQDKDGLNLDEQTLADLLKTRGYKTQCVGKWHLGVTPEYLPTKRGFDHYFGIPYSNDMNPRVLMRDTTVVEQEADLASLTRKYTEEATKFIREAKGTPFFLYFPHTYPHIPLGASERFRGKSPRGIYGDVLAELDWSVGEVMKTLQETGAAKNTLVVFSSDNGPWYQGSSGRLRGRKGETWEGGVREPFIVSMPGRIPKGKVSTAVGSMLDVTPTIAALCGAPASNKPTDGLNVWKLWTGEAAQMPREPLLYFDGIHLQCARWGQWKLHVARYNRAAYSPAPPQGLLNILLGKPELYDLDNDPQESYDVADLHQDVVKTVLEKVEIQMKTFPSEVQGDWSVTKVKKVSPSPAGAVARSID